MITVRWPRADATFPQVEFRRLFRQIRRSVADDAEMVTAYTDGVVTLRSNRRLDGYHEAADMSGMQGVKVGDFVVHGLDVLRGSVGVSDADGAMSSVCVICAPIADVEPRYFAWQIRAQAASGLPRALARGVREGGADFRRWDTLAELPVLCPPRGVQRAIADYLDTETARIDALIAKKQRMIELVLEWRRSAIEELIGGGRSAVEYLGGTNSVARSAVPLKRLLLGTIAGGTPDSSDDRFWFPDGQGIAWLSISDMVDCGVTNSTVRSLTSEGLEASRLTIAPPGTLLFAMYASLGKLSTTGMPAVWNQAILGLVPNPDDVDVRFLALWMEVLRNHLSFLARSSTQENLNAEQVRELPVPSWPRDEQEDLVDQLESRLGQLAATEGVISRQIDLLRERRQALITAVVTGELEVPGVAA